MSNKEIANAFALLAQLMELHQEESFKIKSYSNAYRILRNEEKPLAGMDLNELKSIRGVGDAIALKIMELVQKGSMKLLNSFLEKTPDGLIQLIGIKGLGVKKIMSLWKELEIESPGELLYACNENRLVDLKGFGAKSQQNIKEQLEYYFQSQEKYRWASIEEDADKLLVDLKMLYGTDNVFLTGQFKQLLPVVEKLDYVIMGNPDKMNSSELFNEYSNSDDNTFECRLESSGVKIALHFSNEQNFAISMIKSSSSPQLFEYISKNSSTDAVFTEAQIFESAGLPFIPYELRDFDGIEKFKNIPNLIGNDDIRGVLHAHCQYSDGATSLKDLADYVKNCGYSYLGISDHSQSAFYANGLKPERVIEQWAEIDSLNSSYTDFKIFKGIESDIKFDGSLDYDDDILSAFDFVIASIHSNLKMSEEKATERLLKAIENPFTTILGHPTGRLLLSRPGYPINHKKVIDACAANDVVIEINANPLRLDLDYKYLRYAFEKSVKIAINPDAHNLKGVHDIRYGVQVARKAMMTKDQCINSLSLAEFEKFLISKKIKST